MAISITLSSYSLGDNADEAFFDSWASYVAEHIDEHVGFDVASVDQQRFGAPGEDVISGATDEQRAALREALRHTLWDQFCGESTTG